MKPPMLEGQSGPKKHLPHYYMHYQGWKKKWDEWVPETRVLKFNEENLRRQKEMQQQSRLAKKQSAADSVRDSKKRSASDAKNDSGNARKKARSVIEHVEAEEVFKVRPEIKVPVPDELKRQLVDDWDFVTRQKKLVQLPRTPSVKKIIDVYVADQTQGNKQKDLLKEMTRGLLKYFEHCLGSILLYRHERSQYNDIYVQIEENRLAAEEEKENASSESANKKDNESDDTKKKIGAGNDSENGGENAEEKEDGGDSEEATKKATSLAEVYGAEHLLRLFVKLPMVLAHTDMEEDAARILVDQLNDFLKYMQKNAGALFLSDYDNAPPDVARASA